VGLSGPATAGRPLKAAAGTILFRPGERCRGYLQVLSGAIRVRLTHAGGREIDLYTVGPGDVCLQTFACLTQGLDYTAEGVADTDLTGLLIPAERFHEALRDEAFRDAVMGSVARRFGEMERLVERMAFEGLDARLATALLARADGAGVVIATHEELAAACGSAREAVSRKLKRFAALGLVAMGRGQVRLCDQGGLRRLAAPARHDPV
jgi:CRP/FNR family transcriptional regulator, anaerobic regulatory protein